MNQSHLCDKNSSILLKKKVLNFAVLQKSRSNLVTAAGIFPINHMTSQSTFFGGSFDIVQHTSAHHELMTTRKYSREYK